MSKLLFGLAALVLCCAVAPARAGDDAEAKAQLKKLQDGDEQAAAALLRLGGKAALTLVEFLQQDHANDAVTAWAASDVLGRMGAPAVPALRDGLKKGNPVFALSALKQLGSAAKPALPAVLGVVKAGGMPQVDPQQGAAYALAIEVVGNIGPDAREAVPMLIVHLTPKNPAATHVIVALGRMGAAAKDAVPALTEIAANGPAALRVHAKDSLRKIKG